MSTSGVEQTRVTEQLQRQVAELTDRLAQAEQAALDSKHADEQLMQKCEELQSRLVQSKQTTLQAEQTAASARTEQQQSAAEVEGLKAQVVQLTDEQVREL